MFYSVLKQCRLISSILYMSLLGDGREGQVLHILRAIWEVSSWSLHHQRETQGQLEEDFTGKIGV